MLNYERDIDVDELIDHQKEQGTRSGKCVHLQGRGSSYQEIVADENNTFDIGSPADEVLADIEKGVDKGKSEMVIEWSDVACTYPAAKNNNNETKTTLLKASGQLRTRELTAIMGPSGSGKSTLLDILSGRKTTGNVTGSIRIFGEDVSNMKHASKLLQKVSAFVPQDIFFFPMQTPEEAVQFVARLTHEKEEEASLEKCHAILKDVGLCDPELYTRPIGAELAGGLTVRGISGGEQKRLALACALAMDPQLIMLDEITSGLDSENADATIQLLKTVCITKNVAAAVIIHQPDGYIFQKFDRLVLLSKGVCVFSDDTAELQNFYNTVMEEEMPSSWHEVPLDLMRKLGKLDLTPFPTKAELTSTFGQLVVPNSLKGRKMTTANVPEHKKLLVVLTRNCTNHYLRNLTNLAARMATYALCSFIDGSLFWQVGDQRPEAVIGALTFIILLSYLLPFMTLPIFVHEKKFFIMERSLGLYSPWIYCVSQALLEFCLVVMSSVISTVILIPMVGLWNPSMSKLESFLITLCGMVLSGLTGSSLLQFFAICLPSQDLAFVICSGITAIWLGISGGFVAFPAIAGWISWLQWLSACKYSLAALSRGVFQGTPNEVILDVSGMDRPGSIAGNLGVLFVFYLFFAFAAMVALSKQKHRR